MINEMLTMGGVLRKVYPVGAIYISTVSTSPATLFGFGTWEQIEDRFLLAAGSTYTAGATGGEATHQLTVDEMPSHTHGIGYNVYSRAGTECAIPDATFRYTYQSKPAGGSQPHNNMPPYLTVYVWKRTA